MGIRVQDLRGDLRVLGFLLAETLKDKRHIEVNPGALKPEGCYRGNGALEAHRLSPILTLES